MLGQHLPKYGVPGMQQVSQVCSSVYLMPSGAEVSQFCHPAIGQYKLQYLITLVVSHDPYFIIHYIGWLNLNDKEFNQLPLFTQTNKWHSPEYLTV